MGVWKHVNAHAGRQFVKHVVPAVLKPARTLWNEIIGFIFICFAVMFGFKAGHLYMDMASHTGAGGDEVIRFVIAASCTALMLYFGVTSFLRARKISRS